MSSRNAFFQNGLVRFTAAALFVLFPGAAFAATTTAASGSTLAGEEQCVPKSIEQQVTACEGSLSIGTQMRKAQVGTSTKPPEVRKKEEVGPSLDRQMVKDIIQSSFSRKREARAIDILRQEIALIKKLADQTPDANPEKAEILKRLADALKEMYDAINFQARTMDEKIFQLQQSGKKDDARKMRAQQKALDDRAKSFREASIKAYVEIRNKFSNYDGYDEILFAIAYEVDQLASELTKAEDKSAYREQGRIFYQELIQKYPKSRFIPHAWMAFGEYFFHEARIVTDAYEAYQKVIDWGEKDNPNYVVAMYYQAWCLMNMHEPKKSIQQFTKVIDFADRNPENREAKVVARRSKLELVQPYSDIGNPGDGWKLFQKIGGDQQHAMLDRLANVYYNAGRWEDAIIVFHQLQELELSNFQNNNGDDLCGYQTKITYAAIAARAKDKQVVEIQRQIELSKKFATEKHAEKKIKTCNQDTISIAWDIATQWNLECVGSETSPGTKDPNTMKLVVDLYDTILKAYPDLDSWDVEGFDENTKPTRYRVAYYKAELYWYMEDWANCAPAFDAVVDMDPGGEYTSDSAYAAVLCYNKVYVTERADKDKERTYQLEAGDSKIKKDCQRKCQREKSKDPECVSKCEEENRPVLEAKELSELETGILRSYNRYICFVKDAKADELVNIKYRRARIYYEANRFAEASVLFKDIAINHSDHETAIYAANLYLDCLNALGSMIAKPIPSCYDDLADIVDVFIDTSKAPGLHLMKDPEFAGQIKSLKVGVMRKKAESLTQRGRFTESAEIYLDIYRNYKGVYDDRGMCEVLFNTAINMESARLVMKAINVREHMIERYPDCEHSKKAAYYIGQNYHALQNFSKAAENYVAFATKYTGEEEAPDAMANAVMFYIGLNEIDQALRTVSLYEKTYAKRRLADTASLVFGAGFIHVNTKDWEDVKKWYTRYLKTYSRANLIDEQVQAHAMIGDAFWNQARPDHAQAIKNYERAFSTFEKGQKSITDPGRKAKALIAAAKSLYYIAEVKFIAFQKIRFPEFVGEKGLPKKIETWWGKKMKETMSAEDITAIEQWKRDRKRLARWGYYEEGKSIKEQMLAVKKEERKEELEIQFNYWAEHRLGPWFEQKIKSLNEGLAAFGKVAALHVPEWEMAAAARAADMQLSFMKDIYDSPLPPSMKGDQELIDIYRGEMDKRAEPYRQGAVTAYEHCLNISTKVRWFNENSLRCEKELNTLEPMRYPISEEIRVMPKASFRFIAPPDPIMELETEAQKRERELSKATDNIETSGN
ncbi:MAG: hypothetical protein GX146_11815 [Myxococcales bacterium]|jgi:TolA-binding protein|nr:hypothetical protein [Myxococcales bacterium]